MTKSNHAIPDYLLKLADGFSTHTRVASRFWITLALLSLLVLMPSSSKAKNPDSIKIWFVGVEVNKSDFYPFSALLVSILIIGFGSAHIQLVRSRYLLQRAIVLNLKNKSFLPSNIDLRDFVDSIVSQTINRTAPLAQYLRGKYQFFPEAEDCPKTVNFISIGYYILLKLVNVIVMYVFPAFALFVSFSQGNLTLWKNKSWGIPNILLIYVCGVASLILIQLIGSEILCTQRAIKRILSKRDS